MSTLFCIDSYLSKQERADTCRNLIHKIRKIYPDKKILLINKFRESWGLDKEVDFYYFHGEGFLVGEPPKELLTSKRYSRPYTYYQIDPGTLENWFPLVNVSDHVADVYNSFILAANIGKTLGFKKIFKIEYDTVLDDEEFLSMNDAIETFQDYLFYGERKEGVWARPHQYLIDVHIIGFSTSLFDGFSLVKNDQEFWDLCERVGYFGKWVEYLIPAVTEEQRKTRTLNGITHYTRVHDMYPKTVFDAISSPGEWSTTWDIIPKICRVTSVSKNEHAAPNELVIFYLGKKTFQHGETHVDCWCQVTTLKDGNIIYEKEVRISPFAWSYDHLMIYEPVKIVIKNKSTAVDSHNEYIIAPEDLENINPRFVFNT